MKRTYALVQVAATLMADASGRHWGYDLAKRSGVRSGVLYPILRRLLDEGLLEDGWEEQDHAGRGKRPPRRYYEITDAGKIALGALVAEARRDARFTGAIGRGIAKGVVG